MAKQTEHIIVGVLATVAVIIIAGLVYSILAVPANAAVSTVATAVTSSGQYPGLPVYSSPENLPAAPAGYYYTDEPIGNPVYIVNDPPNVNNLPIYLDVIATPNPTPAAIQGGMLPAPSVNYAALYPGVPLIASLQDAPIGEPWTTTNNGTTPIFIDESTGIPYYSAPSNLPPGITL